MSLYFKLRSKVAIAWSKYLPKSYLKFTMKHTKRHDTVSEALVKKPLNECRVALITSAGVHLATDPPFNVETLEGDPSIRIVPASATPDDLSVTHIYYDTRHAKADISIVFPLEQLKELAESGYIGSVSNANIGANGGTLNHEPHEKITAPEIARVLREDGVDIALLTPG